MDATFARRASPAGSRTAASRDAGDRPPSDAASASAAERRDGARRDVRGRGRASPRAHRAARPRRNASSRPPPAPPQTRRSPSFSFAPSQVGAGRGGVCGVRTVRHTDRGGSSAAVDKASRFNGYVVWKMRLIDSQTKAHTLMVLRHRKKTKKQQPSRRSHACALSLGRGALVPVSGGHRGHARGDVPLDSPHGQGVRRSRRAAHGGRRARARASTRRRRTRARRPRSGGW